MIIELILIEWVLSTFLLYNFLIFIKMFNLILFMAFFGNYDAIIM